MRKKKEVKPGPVQPDPTIADPVQLELVQDAPAAPADLMIPAGTYIEGIPLGTRLMLSTVGVLALILLGLVMYIIFLP